jgi:hypothetical protein
MVAIGMGGGARRNRMRMSIGVSERDAARRHGLRGIVAQWRSSTAIGGGRVLRAS